MICPVHNTVIFFFCTDPSISTSLFGTQRPEQNSSYSFTKVFSWMKSMFWLIFHCNLFLRAQKTSQRVSARKTKLHCKCIGVTSFLHLPIEVVSLLQIMAKPLPEPRMSSYSTLIRTVHIQYAHQASIHVKRCWHFWNKLTVKTMYNIYIYVQSTWSIVKKKFTTLMLTISVQQSVQHLQYSLE